MPDAPTQSPYYTLLMDERRHLMFSLFMQVLIISPTAHEIFDALLKQHKITHAEFSDFIHDWSEKEHTMGWCKDPDCKVPNGNKNET